MSTDKKIAVVLVLFAALVAFIIWAARRWLATRTDQAEFDADLDETSILELTHDVPDRASGDTLAGPWLEIDQGQEHSAADRTADLRLPAEARSADPADSAGGSDDGGRPEDRGARLDAGLRLTPAQRRRAVHKGRIPRDLPAPVSDRSAARTFPMSADASTSRGGESTERLISGILAAELDAGRWLAAEADRAREEETLRERAELDARIDEAYRVVGAGFADLEARNWLELAA